MQAVSLGNRRRPIALTREESAIVLCDGEVVGSKNSSPTPPRTTRRVLARDGHRCVHYQGSRNLHVYHIIFRENGESHDLRNLPNVCARCHGMIHNGLLKISGIAPFDLVVTGRSGRSLEGEKALCRTENSHGTAQSWPTFDRSCEGEEVR